MLFTAQMEVPPMRLFLVTFLSERGLNCDCCVEIYRCEADVFAADEVAAKAIVEKEFRGKDIRLEDLGEIDKVVVPGIKLNKWHTVYHGEHNYVPSDLKTAMAAS